MSEAKILDDNVNKYNLPKMFFWRGKRVTEAVYEMRCKQQKIGANRRSVYGTKDKTLQLKTNLKSKDSTFTLINSNENSSELGIQITDVHSLNSEIENSATSENPYEAVEQEVGESGEIFLESEDLLLDSDCDIFEEVASYSQEINKEEIQQKEHRAAIFSEENKKNCFQDTNLDTFVDKPDYFNLDVKEKGVDSSIDILSREPNICNKDFKGDIGVNFRFLNEEELEECMIVKNEDTCKAASSTMKLINLDKKELGTVEEDESSSDCIVITAGNSPKKEVTESIKDKITEEIILKDFKIIDNDGEDKCIVTKGTEESEKTVIHRDNLVYCSRTEYLSNHKKQSKLKRTKKVYECSWCPFTTSYKSTYLDHVLDHEEPDFPYKSKSDATREPTCLEDHTTIKPSAYNVRTRKRKNLNIHQTECLKSITTWKPSKDRPKKERNKFRCHFVPCPFQTDIKEALNTHEWIQHRVGSSKVKKYKCNFQYCQFETFRKGILVDHVTAHAKYDQYQCKQCSYRALDWEKLKNHIIEHVTRSDNQH